MNTLINSQVAKKLAVTKTTIANYIQEAHDKKNNLQTALIDGKVKLVDTSANWNELEKLAKEGRRFNRNTTHKTVAVPQSFYNLFDKQSQFEIFRDLETLQEIDLKYHYTNHGAEFWDSRYKQKISHVSIAIEQLLKNCIYDIKNSFEQKFNFIDIGCGNGFPSHLLLKEDLVKKYIGLDISKELLDICKENLQEFSTNTEIETHAIDLQKSGLEELVEKWNSDESNLFAFIGNTICNYNQVDRADLLNSIQRVMTKNDMLLISYSLNSKENNTNFKYVQDQNMERAWLPKLIGIDVSQCSYNHVFDAEKKCKIKYLQLDKNYTIKFHLFNEDKTVIFNTGEQIALWKHYLFSLEEIVKELSFSNFSIKFLKVHQDNVFIGCQIAVPC